MRHPAPHYPHAANAGCDLAGVAHVAETPAAHAYDIYHVDQLISLVKSTLQNHTPNYEKVSVEIHLNHTPFLISLITFTALHLLSFLRSGQYII